MAKTSKKALRGSASPSKKVVITKNKAKALLGSGARKPIPKPEVIRKMAAQIRGQKAEHQLTRGTHQPAPHGVVRARAGTGKTFTLVLGVANIYRDRQLPDSWMVGEAGAGNLTLWGKVEKELGFKVQPSPQQKAVWDFMALEHPRTVCYVAFNSSIVEEFSEKYAWLVAALDQIGVKLTFSTIHSLGNAACREAYKLRGFKSVNQYRVSDLLSAFWQVDLREVWKEKAETIQAIQELVGLCKLTLVGGQLWEGGPQEQRLVKDEELQILADHYGILLNGNREEVFKAVQHLLNVCREVERDGSGRIDFNDQIWLPVVNNLPVEKFDLILPDEAQDMNRCQQELVLKAGKRIILVGDDRQAIYGFAGADTDSLDRMSALLAASGRGEVETMYLTQTRRCGKAIVEKAKTLVPDFEAHKSNRPGKISRVNFEELEAPDEPVDNEEINDPGVVGEMKAGSPYSLSEKDMVLCRVNAPLVGLAFRMLKAGKRVNIKGRDIGTGLKTFIKKSKAKEVGEFLSWLDKFQQEQVERMNRRRNPDTEAIVALEDKCTCLRTFAEGAFTLKDIYKAIDEVFKGKVCPNCGTSYDEGVKVCYKDNCKTGYKGTPLVKPEGTLLSSVHRAKGLEAKRVFILRPDLMPHPKAKEGWEKGQEANLEYVAITRAIEELVYVDGKFEGKEEGNES